MATERTSVLTSLTLMHPLEELFLESDWKSIAAARQHRDQRLSELQAQGYVCEAENLYTIDTGRRVFLVRATPPDSQSKAPKDRTTPADPLPTRAEASHPEPERKRQPRSHRRPNSAKLPYDRSQPH
jgi:hypothetical protein